MEPQDIKLVVEQIKPLFRAIGEDIELMSVDERHHHVCIKLILPGERIQRPVVPELRSLGEELRRRNPSIRSVSIVEATPSAK